MATDDSGSRNIISGVCDTKKPTCIPSYDWYGIADFIWHGKTIQLACEELGYTWAEIRFVITPEQKQYLLDVSMLASVREEYLGASTTDN